MAGLLCWLYARSKRLPFVLRLENIDPDRSKPAYEKAIMDELSWFGLDWDVLVYQSHNRSRHDAALDELEKRGLLYPCACSRTRLKSMAIRSPDGGFAYDNHCRMRKLPPGGWRHSKESIRIMLPDDPVEIVDNSGIVIRQHPVNDMGDPVALRRDGAIAYHLACVVDDASMPLVKLIRGRDLIHSAPTQRLIQQLLGFPALAYRHHFLLLDHAGGKLAKFHGSVSVPELKNHFSASALCGLISHWCGLNPSAQPCHPRELVADFEWSKVRCDDLTIEWLDGHFLIHDQHP